MNNFQPFEVVGHGSETQFQVGEEFNLQFSVVCRACTAELFVSIFLS